jgi:DNA processing protein
MEYGIRQLTRGEFPPKLLEIPEPPKQLYVRGELPPKDTACLLVVGSRNYTNYGKQVVEYLISGLRGYPISIISGLALGIDGLAHNAALEAGLHTLGIPGSGIDDRVIGPRTNFGLAQRILTEGGGLLSEYEPDFRATKWSFPQRNRIMVGLSDATLVIEASEKSGTLITARLTVDYNRDLLVVPGNIFGENSKGPHQFLKLGAIPVTTPEDILETLHIETTYKQTTAPINFADYTPEELKVLSLLIEPKDRDTLIRELGVPTHEAAVLLMKLELSNCIKEENGVFYKT